MVFSQRQSNWLHLHRCGLSSAETEDPNLALESEKDISASAPTDGDPVSMDSFQDHTTSVAKIERRVGCSIKANKQVAWSAASNRGTKQRSSIIKTKSLFRSISSSEVEVKTCAAAMNTSPQNTDDRIGNSFSLAPRRSVFQYFGAGDSKSPFPFGRPLYQMNRHPSNANPANNILMTDQSTNEDSADSQPSFNLPSRLTACMQRSTHNVPSTPPPMEDSFDSPPVLNKTCKAFFDFDHNSTPPALFLCEDTFRTKRF